MLTRISRINTVIPLTDCLRNANIVFVISSDTSEIQKFYAEIFNEHLVVGVAFITFEKYTIRVKDKNL